MLKKSIIQRTLETNSDVSNTPPMAKQDCTDVVHISVFLTVQEITKMRMKKKEMV
jgi:hypothetical protein